MPLRGLAHLCFLFDTHVIDRIVDGVGALPRLLSAAPRLLQTGYVSSYALMMWVGALACMGYMLGLVPPVMLLSFSKSTRRSRRIRFKKISSIHDSDG